MTATSPTRADSPAGDDRSSSADPSSSGDAPSGAGAPSPAPLDAARAPVGPGAVTVVGALLAVGVTALGVVAVQTAASAAGLVSGEPWLATWLTGVDGQRPPSWTPAAAVPAALIGLWLLLVAVKPRPRTGVQVSAQTGVFLRPKDVARLARATADDVDGVVDVSAAATRRAVTLRVGTTGDDGVAARVGAAVSDRLTPLARTPRVRVSMKKVSP
ncbi:MAG: DUF6286 domain-containing protein [Phycicoccus sp.]